MKPQETQLKMLETEVYGWLLNDDGVLYNTLNNNPRKRLFIRPFISRNMPVKIFRAEIGRKIEKDMLALKDEIDSFEKQVQEGGMEIRSIALSAVSYGESALYSMVHYGSKCSEKQSVNVVEE